MSTQLRRWSFDLYTYNPPAVPVTDYTLTAPSLDLMSTQLRRWSFDLYTYNPPAVPATEYTFTAPSLDSGYVGYASGNFSLVANGVSSPALVVTPHTTGTGTFTPSSLTITDTSAHTFTYTPATAETVDISVTHTGGGFTGDPSPVSYRSIELPTPLSGATFWCVPAVLAPSKTATVTFFGAETTWTQTPPLIDARGVPSTDTSWLLGTPSVVSDTEFTIQVTAGVSSGVVAWVDTANGLVAYQSIGNHMW